MQSPAAHDSNGAQREAHEIAGKAGKALWSDAAGTEIDTADTAGEKSGVKRRESDQENKTIKTSAVIQHLLPHSAENARCKRNQGFTGGVGRISDA